MGVSCHTQDQKSSDVKKMRGYLANLGVGAETLEELRMFYFSRNISNRTPMNSAMPMPERMYNSLLLVPLAM